MKPTLTIIANIKVNSAHVVSKISLTIFSCTQRARGSQSYIGAILSLLALSLFSWSSHAQTSIIASRNSVKVVIAADSKRTRTTYNDDGSVRATESRQACKIHRATGFYFGCSGYCSQIAATDVVIKTSTALTFDKNVTLATDAVKRALSSFLKQQREAKPLVYAKHPDPKKAVVQILFVGFRNNAPYAMGVDFFDDKLGQPEIPIRIETTRITPQSLALSIGHNEALSNVSNAEKSRLRARQPEEISRYLVDLEIRAEGKEVGPPIDLLRVTKTGPCWIDHKTDGEDCETDIPNCPKPTPSPAKPKQRQPASRPRKHS